MNEPGDIVAIVAGPHAGESGTIVFHPSLPFWRGTRCLVELEDGTRVAVASENVEAG